MQVRVAWVVLLRVPLLRRDLRAPTKSRVNAISAPLLVLTRTAVGGTLTNPVLLRGGLLVDPRGSLPRGLARLAPLPPPATLRSQEANTPTRLRIVLSVVLLTLLQKRGMCLMKQYVASLLRAKKSLKRRTL